MHLRGMRHVISLPDPGPQQLRSWFEAHRQRCALPARVSFRICTSRQSRYRQRPIGPLTARGAIARMANQQRISAESA
jgi:hypothetical protein